MSVIYLYFDGCSKGNPGRAGAAYWIEKENGEKYGENIYLDITTNNVAEYNGLLLGLKHLVKHKQFMVIVWLL